MSVSKQSDDMKKAKAGVGAETEATGPTATRSADSGPGTPAEGGQAEKMAGLEAQLAELHAQTARLEDEADSANEKMAVLAGERDTWQGKATAIYDQYLRTKADFDSYRKRAERDAEDKIARGKAGFLRAVLEVMDNFDRFLQATEKNGAEGADRSFEAFFKGVSMVRKQLMDTLLKEGVEPVENPVGKLLDPNFHDAVAAQDGGGEHGTVIEELQKGYAFKGLVLRPAKVRVIR